MHLAICIVPAILLLCSPFPVSALSEPPVLTSPTPTQEEPPRASSPGERRQPTGRANPARLTTEVTGFLLDGTKPWERLRIPDLDTVVTPSQQHLLPLLRLLRALQIDVVEEENSISFAPVSSVSVVLDLQRNEIRINNSSRSISPVVGISDITSRLDVYLSAELLSEILLIQIEWNEQEYGFFAKTNRVLNLWKPAPGKSLLGIQTEEIPTNLPELFPPARPRDFSVDFMELDFRPTVGIGGTTGGHTTWAATSNDSPKETFWGSFYGGQYRLQFSHPWIRYDNSGGFQTSQSSPVMLNNAIWEYRLPNAEVLAGDATFGLNDLTFQTVKMAGVRINGLIGVPEDETRWRTTPGLGNAFVTPLVFEGTAPSGSVVELIINDVRIDRQVAPTGTYRFENVWLAPGTLNLVRIITTEPTGFQTVTEKTIFGRAINLPKGGLAYLGGIGTNRDVSNWSARGVFGGGRLLYGLTDSLTVGLTGAAQNNFFIPLETTYLQSGDRQNPTSSVHVGGQVAWIPIEELMLSADVSMSNGSVSSSRGGFRSSFDGIAYKFKVDLYPTPQMQLHSQWFHFGPDFFGGDNLLLRDKQGYSISGTWTINPQWWVAPAVGGVWNNVNNQYKDTLAVDFQHLEVSSTQIPKMTITTGMNRASANWDTEPKTLYTIKVQASPFTNLYCEAFLSHGKYLDQSKYPNFFTGLTLPGLLIYSLPNVAANAQLILGPGHTVGANYWDGTGRKRATVTDFFRFPRSPFQVYTEAGYDLNYQKPYFDNRLQYLIDPLGTNTITMHTQYQNGAWAASLEVNLSELFSFNKGGITRVSDPAIGPDYGGIHGYVFIDANANGQMDPGEPGLENVQVMTENGVHVTTDKNGHFMFPSFGQDKKTRAYLDMNTVPASYSPTHGIQSAYLFPGTLTQINFGVSPVNSISGIVQGIGPGQSTQRLVGIRVYLTRTTDEKTIAESISAQDGSYYLGDVKPGEYYLRLDPKTLPPNSVPPDEQTRIEVSPKTEPQELKVPLVVRISQASVAKAAD